MVNDLAQFEPIFGEAKPEWAGSPTNTNGSSTLNPFIFRAYASDPTRLTIHVSDFLSYTWESCRSINQLEDLRDSIGISGSWSDFVNYVVASLKSKDVKLVMERQSNLNGVISAKLVARKSKGMPLLSVSLSKLVDSAASEAIANMSLELFKAYHVLQDSLVTEQDRCSRLIQTSSSEKEKSLTMKRKLDDAMNTEKQGFHKDFRSTASALNSDTGALNTTDKQPATEVQSAKVVNRVVPAFRRAKVRGVVLHDADEENDD